MSASAIIGIAIAILILLGDPIVAAMRSAYMFVSTRLPKLPSVGGWFDAKLELPLWKVVALVVVLWLVSGGVTWQGCKLPEVPGFPWPVISQKATAVTYVYEKDDSTIPSGVMAALAKLNARGIVATTFEDDTTDGSGDVPEQYKVALAESKTQGVPLLVVQAGERVIRTVKAPSTEARVLEAVP
jgi:hypothetical protein